MMKKRILLLLSISLSLLSMTVAFVSCELVTPQPEKGTMRVLSIGIDYRNSNAYLITPYTKALNACPYDAQELAECFLAINPEASIVQMIQRRSTPSTEYPDIHLYPNRDGILYQIDVLAQNATTEDITIIYYSGHGTDIDFDYSLVPAYTEGTLDLYLSTTGGSYVLNYDYPFITMLELREAINKIKGTVLLILDCCNSGGHIVQDESTIPIYSFNSSAWKDAMELLFASNDTQKKNHNQFVLAASASTQLSHEPSVTANRDDTIHKHGFFTEVLLEALGWSHDSDGKGYYTNIPLAGNKGTVTLDDVYQYIDKHQRYPHLPWIAKNWYSDTGQYPQLTHGPYDLVLFQY